MDDSSENLQDEWSSPLSVILEENEDSFENRSDSQLNDSLYKQEGDNKDVNPRSSEMISKEASDLASLLYVSDDDISDSGSDFTEEETGGSDDENWVSLKEEEIEILGDYSSFTEEETEGSSSSDTDPSQKAVYDYWCDGKFMKTTYEDESVDDPGELNSGQCLPVCNVAGGSQVMSSADLQPSGVDAADEELTIDDLYNASDSLYQPKKVLHELSCPMQTDEERNRVYDRWINDVEVWERNRLMWLDEIGSSEGFDTFHYKDRTFLVKAGEEISSECDKLPLLKRESTVSYEKSLHDTPESEEVSLKDSSSFVPSLMLFHNDEDEQQGKNVAFNLAATNRFWEEWYQLERLRRHKILSDMGLPNWYEALLEEQISKGVLVFDLNNDSELAYSGNKCLEFVTQDSKDNGDPNNNLQENVSKKLPLCPYTISFYDALVYQFTDRNLWSKLPRFKPSGK